MQTFSGSNVQSGMIFDSLGTFTISNFSINKCGSDSGSYQVTVVPPFNVNLGNDAAICAGQSLTLQAQIPDITRQFLTSDTAHSGYPGAMFNIKAHYGVTIDSFALKYLSNQPVQAEIWGKPGSYRTFEQNQAAWTELSSFYNFPVAPLGQMTVIPIDVDWHIPAGDTFAFYVTTANNINEASGPGIGIQQGIVYKTDGVIDFIQGSKNNYPFGAFTGPYVLDMIIYYSTNAGLHYQWNTGDTTSFIHVTPLHDTMYTVIVHDTSCSNRDTLLVKVGAIPIAYAGPDTTLCSGTNYIMPATSNANIVAWSPVTGLNNPAILNPVFDYNQSVQFVLTASDSDGCNTTDTVSIRVSAINLDAGSDTTLCNGESYIMTATSSTPNVTWSPATGLSATDIVNPTFSYDQAIQYTLVAIDSNGCTATDSVKIGVEYCASNIRIPEAFTPNGDGVNDHFTVFGDYIESYQIRIFNRWGEEVYASNDLSELNNLSRGWDGTYKGKKQDIGTFVYFISAKDLNGKTIEKKGNVTLIR